ncbi:MAG: helix-turn-helix transcriptional regulator [Gammaproteobacteria bacterium]|nr:helix-turn-helix transcriptional regulator [Gammaproteobacteria bacterium]
MDHSNFEFVFVTVCLFGSIQGVLLGTTLWLLKTPAPQANRLLAASVFLCSLFLLDIPFAAYPEYFYTPLRWLRFTYFLRFALGPLLYLYTKALTAPTPSFERKTLWHFSPLLLGIFLYSPFFIAESDLQRIALKLFLEGGASSSYHIQLLIWVPVVASLAMVLQMLVYIVAILKLLKKHAIQIREHFSSIERINLNWLKFLLLSMAVFWMIYVSTVVVPAFLHKPLLTPYYYVTYLGISLLLYCVGYFGLFQPTIFVRPLPVEKGSDRPSGRYLTSTLTPDRAKAYKEKLLQCLERDKPYLECNLTLQQLAHKLAIRPIHKLSQLINTEFKQNFFDLINQYRIEEAKKYLEQDKRKESILDVAMAVGFNSQSAFYNAFKKHTQVTPKQYEKNHKDLITSPAGGRGRRVSVG